MTALTPVGLDLDGGLASQRRLLARLRSVHDLGGYAASFRLRSRRTVADQLRTRIADLRRRSPAPWLTFFGSGDYHHLSLLLLETLPPQDAPLTLVLIDSHPDWCTLPPRFHCGHWIARSLELPHVERAVLIGTGKSGLRWSNCYWAPLRAMARGRLEVFPSRCPRARLPLRWPPRDRTPGALTARWWGSELHWSTLTSLGVSAAFSHISRALAGRNIYISVDKNVLRAADASTDWGNGALSINDVIRGLRVLSASCHVVGADVCGDRTPGPLKGMLKRIDAGRIGAPWNAPTGPEVRRNERANLAILRALTHDSHTRPRHPTRITAASWEHATSPARPTDSSDRHATAL
jgi:hypothetical protein